MTDMQKSFTVRRLAALLLAGTVALAAAACSSPEERSREAAARGAAYLAEGKTNEAVLELRNAVKDAPRNGEYRFALGQAYVTRGNLPAAGREFIRAAELMPERADVQLRAAVVALAAGDFAAARTHAEAALAVDSTNIEAQIVNANALAGQRDPDAALKELDEAIAGAPADGRPYTSLGTLKAQAGNMAEAEAAFRKAVELDPKAANARLALAYFLLNQARLPEAEAALRDTLAIDPDNRMANRMLAMHYLNQGKDTEAAAPLTRLSQAGDSAATIALADLHVRMNEPDKARPLYESLKDTRSGAGLAVARLAMLDYRAGNRDEAHKTLDGALASDPNNDILMSMQARWYLAEGRSDEALAITEKAVKAVPNSAVAHFTRGIALASTGDPQNATAEYKEAVRLNPRATAAQLQLSNLALSAGNYTEAAGHARDVLQVAPGSAEAHLALAAALVAGRDFTAAGRELAILRKETPNDPAVLALSGRLLALQGKSGEAIAELDKALAAEPGNLSALTARLTADAQLKRYADGRSRVARALAERPDDGRLMILAARFESSAGDAAAAERHLRRAIEADPANLEAYSLLGGLYVTQNRLDEARQEFERVAARQPSSVAARTMVGIILGQQGRHDESRKVYERLVAETDRAPVAANNLAWLYAESGEQLDRAVTLAEGAANQLRELPQAHDTLGWVYYKKSLPDLAARSFQRSVDLAPGNPVYHYHLGIALAKVGRREVAKNALEKALTIKPDFAGADDARAVLATLQ